MSDIRHQPGVPTQALAYAAGDVIDRHRHDEHQLIYVSTGVIAITTEHGSWVAAPDRAVWIPAGIWHEHRFYGPTLFHSVGFMTAPTHLPIPLHLPTGTPTVVAAGGLIRELMIACTEAGLRPGEERRIRAVLIDRLGRVEVQPLSLPRAQDPRLARACQLVTDDLSQPRPVSWLARAAGTSDRTLTRLFRTEFGMTYPAVADPDPGPAFAHPPGRGGVGHRDRPPLRLRHRQRLHRHLHPDHGPDPRPVPGHPGRYRVTPALTGR